jgi:predicted transporter
VKKFLLILTDLALIGLATVAYADTSDLISVTAPEPETIVLLGLVLLAFAAYGLYMRKKRKTK